MKEGRERERDGERAREKEKERESEWHNNFKYSSLFFQKYYKIA